MPNDGRLSNSRLTLKSGRTVILEGLDQRLTYHGLLEGLPYPKLNDSLIESAIYEARKRCVPGGEPFLIPPPRRGHEDEPGEMSELAKRFSKSIRQPLEFLPGVVCIGSFYDLNTALDSDWIFSTLVVVWFQDEFALPIVEPALSCLLEVDWENLSTGADP